MMISFFEGFASMFDRALAAVLLLILSPAMLLIALAVRLGGGGPVLFRQSRVGVAARPYGQPTFTFLKYRSMDPNAVLAPSVSAEMADGVRFKDPVDSRVTPVGRFIRRWSLDELPQLWNVMRGDMAMVGPRPPVPEEVNRYPVFARRRLHGIPGITGPWQVGGRSEIDFRTQVEMDVAYLSNRSWKGDCSLLLKTIPAVLGGKGAW